MMKAKPGDSHKEGKTTAHKLPHSSRDDLSDNSILFTDGSVDAKTHIGFGAYLAVENVEAPAVELIAQVKTGISPRIYGALNEN